MQGFRLATFSLVSEREREPHSSWQPRASPSEPEAYLPVGELSEREPRDW